MKILITADWHIKGERPICRLDDNVECASGFHFFRTRKETENY